VFRDKAVTNLGVIKLPFSACSCWTLLDVKRRSSWTKGSQGIFSMLELASLAAGFALPHLRFVPVTPRTATVVADATLNLNLPDLLSTTALFLGGAYFSSRDGAGTIPSSGDEVQSWYDSGVRLSPPVTSWYDAGVRLEAPLESPAGVVVPTRAPSPPLAAEVVPARSPAPPFAIEQLIIKERLGKGTQSEVLLGVTPTGSVAVKIGLKAFAIAREASVLSVMSGVAGFPTMLYYEPDGPRSPGGFLVVSLLGPSLDDLLRTRQSQSQSQLTRLSGPTLLRVARCMLRLIRRLHVAGYVHNDIKPANILLGAGSSMQPTQLHLIDFGSCTNISSSTLAQRLVNENDAQAYGPVGTATYASVAADANVRTMRPADDLESLVYTLCDLASGSLPWKGQPDAVKVAMKHENLARGGTELFEGIEDAAASVALQAMWAEVRRCQGADSSEGAAGGTAVDYEACMVALGGNSIDSDPPADAISELAFMAALGQFVPALPDLSFTHPTLETEYTREDSSSTVRRL